MTSQNLRYFIEIAKDLNISVTAKRLFVTQQTLSGHIRRLESYFNVPLFTRSHGLQLTEEGKLLLIEAKKIIAAEDRLFAAFHPSDDASEKKITAACHMARTQDYLPDAVLALSVQYPDVEVNFLDAEKTDLSDALQKGTIDLSIGDSPEPFEGRQLILLDRTPGCIMISDALLRQHLKDKTDEFIRHAQQGVELDELPAEIPIVQDGIISGRSWITKLLPELRLRPRANVNTANSKFQLKLHIDACRNGIAMLLVSEMYVNYLKKNLSSERLDSIHVFPHLLNGERIMRDEYLSYDANKPHPEYFYRFIKCIQEAVAGAKR